VANALGNVENVPKVPKELKGMVGAKARSSGLIGFFFFVVEF